MQNTAAMIRIGDVAPAGAFDGQELRWEGSEYHTGVRVVVDGAPGWVLITRPGKGGDLRVSLDRARSGMAPVYATGVKESRQIVATLGWPMPSRGDVCTTVVGHPGYECHANIESALVGLAFYWLS